MGYTNYWHQHDDITDTNWQLVKVEYDYIKEVFNGIIDDETHQDDEICFNGKGDDGHETFVFNKNVNHKKEYSGQDTSFNFCKTRMKPYDLAVWHLLCFINRICPAVSISRDR